VRRALVRKAQIVLSDPALLVRSLRPDDEGWALRHLVFPADQDDPQSVAVDVHGIGLLSRF
jgi:hypothetical protein